MSKAIKSSISLHDRSQVETRFDYRISKSDKRTQQTYRVDAYFFFPAQMGINKTSYSKDQFYEDVKPALRLREPQYSFKEMTGSKAIKDKAPSPYLTVQSAIDSGFPSEEEYKIIEQIQLFTCWYSEYLNRQLKRRQKNLTLYSSQEIKESSHLIAIKHLIGKSSKLLYRWFKLYSRATNPNIQKEMQLSIELLLHSLKQCIANLVYTLDDAKITHDPLREYLCKWYQVTGMLASRYGFPYLSQTSSSKNRESQYIRIRNLKRRFYHTLFLHVDPKASFLLKQQMGYMLAAAFAGFWALLANILIWKELQFGGFDQMNQTEGLLGIGSLFIFIAFILAYVLKDRIKEIGRSKFKGRFWGRLPDSSLKIWHQNQLGERSIVGFADENMQFLEHKHVHKKILEKREQSFEPPVVFDEQVLHYKKTVTLSRSKLNNLNSAVFSVRDIMRLNIRRYIMKIDDPTEYFKIITDDQQVQSMETPKSYYVDLVVRYSASNQPDPVYECKRLVINKKGLKRLIVAS